MGRSWEAGNPGNPPTEGRVPAGSQGTGRGGPASSGVTGRGARWPGRAGGTYAQVPGVQLHLLLQLRQKLIVEGLQLDQENGCRCRRRLQARRGAWLGAGEGRDPPRDGRAAPPHAGGSGNGRRMEVRLPGPRPMLGGWDSPFPPAGFEFACGLRPFGRGRLLERQDGRRGKREEKS